MTTVGQIRLVELGSNAAFKLKPAARGTGWPHLVDGALHRGGLSAYGEAPHRPAGDFAIFDRRTLVQGTVTLGASVLTPQVSNLSALAQTARPPQALKFTYDEVVKRATELASAPFDGRLPTLPDELTKLDFDAWRQIQFKDNKSLLGSKDSPFRLELFHLGHLYKRPVVVNTLRDGLPTPIPYQASQFNFGSTKFARPLPVNIGFAGFKIWTPLNDPKKYDEFISFIGSELFSVFSAEARNTGCPRAALPSTGAPTKKNSRSTASSGSKRRKPTPTS